MKTRQKVVRDPVLKGSRLIPSKTLFREGKKGGEREGARPIGCSGSLKRSKLAGILMDRGTRSFTLDQFSRMRRFSRDKRCIKPCTYATRIGVPPASLIRGQRCLNATKFRKLATKVFRVSFSLLTQSILIALA